MASTSVPTAVASVATVDQFNSASTTGRLRLRSRPSRWQTRPMLAHVSIQCADFDRSAAFYDTVLAPLGGTRVMEVGDDAIGYGIPPAATFWIGRQHTGDGFRETHFAFVAPDRAAVRAFVEAARAYGTEVLHEPKVWPEYHATYYGGFVRDPDGNNVEAVSLSPD